MRIKATAAAATVVVALSGPGSIPTTDAFVAKLSLPFSGSVRHEGIRRIRATSAFPERVSNVSSPKMGVFPESADPKRRQLRRPFSINPLSPGAGREGLERGFALLRRGAQVDGDDGEAEGEDEGDYEYDDDQLEEYDEGLDSRSNRREGQKCQRRFPWDIFGSGEDLAEDTPAKRVLRAYLLKEDPLAVQKSTLRSTSTSEAASSTPLKLRKYSGDATSECLTFIQPIANVAKRLRRSARVFRQVSWLSWWAQTILSTVAFIILLFSNAVTNRSVRGNILGNGVALALGSLVASGASICWTWGYTLKARSWIKLGSLPEVDDAQLRMRNSLKMGLYINVAGMLLALVGAEQIVGTLVAKVLYAQGFQPSVMVGTSGAAEVAQAQFRALDVFIVQANTNTLLSHFCSLAASLWLLARTPKLAKLAKGIY